MRKPRITGKKAFTLTELIVVIAVLIIISAIATPTVSGVISRANESADKANAKNIEGAIKYAIASNEAGDTNITDVAGALALSGIDKTKTLTAKRAGYAFYYDNKTQTAGAKKEAGPDDVFLSEDGSNPILPDGTVGESETETSTPSGGQTVTTEATAPVETTVSTTIAATSEATTPAETTTVPEPLPYITLETTSLQGIRDDIAHLNIRVNTQEFSEPGEISFINNSVTKEIDILYQSPNNKTYIISYTWRKDPGKEIISTIAPSIYKDEKNRIVPNILKLSIWCGSIGSTQLTVTITDITKSTIIDSAICNVSVS